MAVGVPTNAVSGGVLRVEADGLIEVLDCPLVLTETKVGGALVVVGVGITGV